MSVRKIVAGKYGLTEEAEKRIDSKSYVIMREQALQLANELPPFFSNLKKGTRVREKTSGKVGRIVEQKSIEYDDGRKFYFVKFRGEEKPRYISKADFKIL